MIQYSSSIQRPTGPKVTTLNSAEHIRHVSVASGEIQTIGCIASVVFG